MKNFFLVILIGLSLNTINAQLLLTCESGDRAVEQANCWGFGAVTYTNSSSQIITGKYSARGNSLTNSSPSACWIKTPWLKPGSGAITLKVKLENTSGTGGTIKSGLNYKAVRIRFISYDPNGSYGEGAILSDSFSYQMVSPYTTAQNISYKIPASIENANIAYKVMISFIGNGGSNRPNIDDIIIPGTYWSDPSNNCLPQKFIEDADGDGVQDKDDAYPKDPTKAYNNYYPSKTFGTLMFEDLWPSLGDYDFNDLVLGYKINKVTNAANNLVEIQAKYYIRAIGAANINGFGFQFDNLDPSYITEVSGVKTEKAEWLNLDKNGTELDQKYANIIVFDNVNRLMLNQGGSGINASSGTPFVIPDTAFVTIKFSAEKGKEIKPSDIVINPYLIVNQDRGKEIHLPGNKPSSKASEKLFGQSQDNSDKGEYYKSKDGNLPWALDVPDNIPYMNEREDFIKGYLRFTKWAESNGKEYNNWYDNSDGNINSSAIYKQ